MTKTMSVDEEELLDKLSQQYKVHEVSALTEDEQKMYNVRGANDITGRLLKIKQSELVYSVSNYITMYIKSGLDIKSLPSEVIALFPFYKKLHNFIREKGITIHVIPTAKVSKPVILIGVDDKHALKMINVFVRTESACSSKEDFKDEILLILKFLFATALFQIRTYNNKLLVYLYDVNREPGLAIKDTKNEVRLGYIDERHGFILFYDDNYIIGSCRVNTKDLGRLSTLHQDMIFQLKYLYRELEKEC